MSFDKPDYYDLVGENINIQRWSKINNKLRLRMRFNDKAQVIYAVRMWHVLQGQEFIAVKK